MQPVPTLRDLSSALVTLGTLEMVLFAVMVRYVCTFPEMVLLAVMVRCGLLIYYAHTKVDSVLIQFIKHVILQMHS